MPLIEISSETAFSNIKDNASSAWPNRKNGENRVEPIAKPSLNPSFLVGREDAIFTIGSCFARNVEVKLQSLGFDVPMRSLKIVDGEFEGVEDNPNIFNNYAVPSILNELEWALDEDRPFDPATGFVEVTNDGFVDLHLTRFFRPVSWDEACARRARIKASMLSVRRCRVVIITLGLVEVWFDNLAGNYLNIAPPKQIAKRYANRFSLHVLSYEDIETRLLAVINLLKRTSAISDKKIIITVSPIPLAQTFTDHDVMIANTYAKSALRTAAEAVSYLTESVDYYPSYESIMLSERSITWKEDMRHVQSELISLNVDRMINAYCKADQDLDSIEKGLAFERSKLWDDACRLYDRSLGLDKNNRSASLGLLRSLPLSKQRSRTPELIKQMILTCPNDIDVVLECSRAARRLKSKEAFQQTAGLLLAFGTIQAYRELLQGIGNFVERPFAIEVIVSAKRLHPRYFLPYQVEAQMQIDDEHWEEAERLLHIAMSLTANSAMCFALLGDIIARKGAKDEARNQYERAIALTPNLPQAVSGLIKLASSAGA